WWASEESAVTGSLWNTDAAEALPAIGLDFAGLDLSGLTAEELRDESKLTTLGWDFIATWEIDPLRNDGFPYLQWQYPNEAPTFTTLPEPFTGTDEDTPVGIAFADIAMVGDAEDSDGEVVAFIVKSVSSGS